MQDQFCELITDSSARSIYQEKSQTEFWCHVSESYPQISKLTFKILLHLATTYLCGSGFSALLHIKNKEKKLTVSGGCVRLALSITQPQISRLVTQIQGQPSH